MAHHDFISLRGSATNAYTLVFGIPVWRLGFHLRLVIEHGTRLRHAIASYAQASRVISFIPLLLHLRRSSLPISAILTSVDDFNLNQTLYCKTTGPALAWECPSASPLGIVPGYRTLSNKLTLLFMETLNGNILIEVLTMSSGRCPISLALQYCGTFLSGF